MRKLFGFSLLFALLLSFGLMASLPMTSYAIEEVTPTPAPNDEEPEGEEPEEEGEEPEEEGEEPEEEVDVEELIEEGIDHLQSGDYEDAIAVMDELLEADPENTTALLIRGVAFAQLEEYDDALADFNTAIELEPWVYDFYIFRGDVHRLMGEETDSLLDYDTAIDINPLNLDAYIRRSDLNYELGDDDAGDFDDFMARAIQAMIDGDSDDAIDYLDEALEMDVDDSMLAVAFYVRGTVYMGTGEESSAEADFTEAIGLDENMDNAYLARGILYRQDDNLEGAGEDFYHRIEIKGEEEIEESMAIGDTLEIEMAYLRVYVITFEGEAGQEVTLSAREIGDAATDPLIALLDPDGNPIAGDDDFGQGINGLDSEIEDFELPEDGTYTLLVSHAEGAYAFGFNGTIEVEISD